MRQTPNQGPTQGRPEGRHYVLSIDVLCAHVLCAGQHDKSAATDVFLPDQIETGLRLFVRGHDHVLQQVAETGLDGAFVLRLDVEIIGHRALLTDVPIGLRQHHAGRFGVTRARFLEVGQ